MQIHLTPTALAKAKALGIIAAALTAGGAGGMVALSQVSSTPSSTELVTSSDATTPPSVDPTQSPSPTPTETETETSTDAATAAPAPTSYSLPTCLPDVKNHGAYVSGVARTAPHGKDGQHGKWVSQAAHSDCGKSVGSSAKPGPKQTESPETTRPDSHSSKAEHTKAATTETPDATKTVDEGASASADPSSKHKSGHGDH